MSETSNLSDVVQIARRFYWKLLLNKFNFSKERVAGEFIK